MKVADALFYVMLFAAIVFQTLGFSYSSSIYFGALALCSIPLLSKVLTAAYSFRDLVIASLLIGFGCWFALHSHKMTILLTALLVIGAKGIDVDSLLKNFMVFKVVSLTLLVVLAILGVFEVTEIEHYRRVSDSFETRVVVNGAATNILHLGYFTVVVLWMYRCFGSIHLVHALIAIAGNAALYVLVTTSVAGFLFTCLSVAVFYGCSHFPGLGNLVSRLAPSLPLLLAAFSLAMGFAYGSSDIVNAVNDLSTGRIAYDHYFLTTYGISMFGLDYTQLITEGNFDNSFVYVPVVYGVLFATLMYVALTSLLRTSSRWGGGTTFSARHFILGLQHCGEHAPECCRQSSSLPARGFSVRHLRTRRCRRCE